MSEFDRPRDWKIRVSKGSKHHLANYIELKDMIKPEVMRWLREQGYVDYKFVEE